MKISINLPEELLKDMDKVCLDEKYERSEFIRTAIRDRIYPKDIHNITSPQPLVPSGEVEKKRIQGWCQLHFEKGVEYPLLKISYEDENGNETISEKLACPKCVKSLEGKGVGRVYYL